MVDRIHLDRDDRETIQNILKYGVRHHEQWVGGRLALARSLQMSDLPDPRAFQKQSQQRGGVELHAPQLTGEGKGPEQDITDLIRALLSVFEGRDYFEDEEGFHDALQRHVRRGLRELRNTWPPRSDFHEYLLQELFFEDEPASDRDKDEGAEELGGRISAVLGQLGIGAELLEAKEGPRLTRFKLTLEMLDDLDRLRKGVGKIGFALGFGQESVTLALATGERQVFLFVPRPPTQWRTVTWKDVRSKLAEPVAEAMILPICLGTDVLGEPYVIDLSEGPHLFVGGTTGSGKSMCLHAILLSLLENRGDQIQLLLIDPKAVEFQAYSGCSQLRDGGIVVSADSALVALEGLAEEMSARQEILGTYDARNISEANERGAGLSRVIAVVDELGDLFLTRREIEAPLIRLAQKARSAGIHLVLATQRPEAATFPGLLRSNIPSRIALAVQKSSESRIILDEVGAESLLMRGDMLVRFAGRQTTRAHGCHVDPADILSAVGGT
ncbi:MAG: FtsK/SpoIIIE domain-containing protein [Gemmatimonadetes bacterium]|nr:FtsK/SpoIIIE domain-containing protein [Gemmatimonadota bacterium]